MKKSVTDIIRDRTITQRVEILESKLHDDFLKGHIGMQIEVTLSERLKHLVTDQETFSHQLKNLKEHLTSLDSTTRAKVDEHRKRLEGTLNKLKSEFSFK
jgi:hypothetical protein